MYAGDEKARLTRVDAVTGTVTAPDIGHLGPVRAVAVSPDGGTAATAGDDGTLRLWELPTGKLHKTVPLATEKPVCCLGYAPDGRHMGVADESGTVRVLTADGAERHQVAGQGAGRLPR